MLVCGGALWVTQNLENAPTYPRLCAPKLPQITAFCCLLGVLTIPTYSDAISPVGCNRCRAIIVGLKQAGSSAEVPFLYQTVIQHVFNSCYHTPASESAV